MAKAAPIAAVGTTDEAPPKKSKKKLIIILVAVLVLALGGAGAAFFLLGHKGEEGKAAEHKAKEPAGPPVFVVMDPFVVNLAEPDNTRYLQVGITYEVKDAAAAEEMKQLTPIIRSRILMVLSSKNVADLSHIEGKQKLMDELVDLARVTLKEREDKDASKGIRDVHFSSFVIQ